MKANIFRFIAAVMFICFLPLTALSATSDIEEIYNFFFIPHTNPGSGKLYATAQISFVDKDFNVAIPDQNHELAYECSVFMNEGGSKGSLLVQDSGVFTHGTDGEEQFEIELGSFTEKTSVRVELTVTLPGGKVLTQEKDFELQAY